MGYFGPAPTTTSAYHTDGTDKWFGEANRGTKISDSCWVIFKMEYTSADWIILFPVDSVTDKASAEPKFIWDDGVTDQESYTYRELGT